MNCAASQTEFKNPLEISFLIRRNFLQAPTLGARTQLADVTAAVSQNYVTTDGQSASQSWCQAPICGGPKTRFLLLSDSCGFVDVRRPI
jgi:hypothetical protein